MAVWQLECDWFAALWLGAANESLPDPFVYTSRFRFLDEWESFQARTRQEHDAAEFDGLRAALAILADAQTSVRVVGTAPGRGLVVRMIGCRDDATAVVAGQQPAPGRASGDIVLRTGTADELPVMLARSMPPARPGGKPGGRFYRSDTEPSGKVVLTQVMAKSPGELYREITAAPRTLTTSVQTVPGPSWAAADPTPGFDILDVEADGRYLSHGRDPITVAPATVADLANQFRSTIARTAPHLG